MIPQFSNPWNYRSQRDALAQSMMARMFPSFYGGGINQQHTYGGINYDSGTRPMPQNVLNNAASATSGDMNPAMTQQINSMPAQNPGIATPVTSPGALPPPQSASMPTLPQPTPASMGAGAPGGKGVGTTPPTPMGAQ